MRLVIASSLFVLLLASVSVGSALAQADCRVGKTQQVAELMFGRKIGNRIAVSEAAWAHFVDREITPRFPDGLSVINAQGQWRDTEHNRIVREPSKLVQIVLPGKADDDQHLTEIADAYKKTFQQQSVAIIVRPACVAF